MNYCSVWLIVAWFWWGEFENYLMLLTVPNKNPYSFSLKKSQCAIEPISSHLQSTEGSAILSTLEEQRWWTNSGPSDPRWVRSHLKPLVQVLLNTHSRAHPLPHYHCHTPTTTHTYPFTSTAKGTEKMERSLAMQYQCIWPERGTIQSQTSSVQMSLSQIPI